MGVESVSILLRWIFEPETRPCPLSDLLVITAQVGDEYLDTKRDMEAHILPLMREHSIRYVQVARAGHFESDGITILEDSTQPTACFTDGDYKLSDELKLNGTVPQYGGVHRCALKFKAWVIETWLREHLHGEVNHAIGYNAEETKRIDKSEYAFASRMAFGFNSEETARISRASEYDGFIRVAFYPLMEWGWNRQRCEDYIFERLGIHWRKSACVFCPFNALRRDAIERHREHPVQVADAMLIEHMSLALNPRGSLYRDGSLIQITTANKNTKAVRLYTQRLAKLPWAIYRVRRIYKGKLTVNKRTGKAEWKKGTVYRSVEQDSRHDHADSAIRLLYDLRDRLSLDIEVRRGIHYAYRERCASTYPTQEEFYTAAPATVPNKARYGIPWFDAQWAQTRQTALFGD